MLRRTASAHSTINGACELGQQSIAHELEDAPVMLLYLRLEQFRAVGAHTVESPRLIALHKRRIAHHVGGQNSSKAISHIALTLSESLRE
jgi:hypothetical protein